jgi:general secretion pathway protein A
MYVSFFGLQQAPFSIAPDPRYLFMSERHREALAHLLYGVGGGGGFVLLSGEIGAGKTTVCRCFLEQVPAGCQVAYIFNPKLTVPELLQSVCDEFGIQVPAQAAGLASVKTYIDLLNTHLLAAHAQGRQCVLVIDEAQNLSAEVLEQLRLLTNLETNERKLLQIILIGQPELRDMLAGAGLEQLAQRVIARYHLGPLTAPETAAYLAHRLAVAGRSAAVPFDAAALRRIHQRSGGVPRRINLLADRALLGAYAEGRPQVGRRIVDRAAAEVFDAGRASTGSGRWRSVGVVAAGVAGGALLMLLALPVGPWGPTAGEPVAAVASTAAGLPTVAANASAAALAAARPGSAPATSATASADASLATARAGTPQLAQPAAAGLPVLDLTQGLAMFPTDETAAWRSLAGLWGVDAAALGNADPCQTLPAHQLRCFRNASGTLALLRQLDRPALLQLQVSGSQVRVARLVALSSQHAVLATDGQVFSVPVDALARVWRGGFATLWRTPAGYVDLLQPGARGPAVDALAQALAAVRQVPPPPPGQALSGALAERLAGFQVGQSLRADGIAGPTTFMQLNRAQGVVEPHLSPDPQER